MADRGRPRIELEPEQIKLIEDGAAQGLTQAQIADKLPMSERTLRSRVAGDDPEILAAYARGRARNLEELASHHYKIAMGRIKDTPVSEQRKALEWRMERQHGWGKRDHVVVEAPEETAAAIRAFMAEADGTVRSD